VARLLFVILVLVLAAGFYFWPRSAVPAAVTPELLERTVRVVEESGQLWQRLADLAEQILESPLFSLLVQYWLPERMQTEVSNLSSEGRTVLTPTPAMSLGPNLDCRRVNLRASGEADYQMDGPLGRAPQGELEQWGAMSAHERAAFAASC
jgi:hypothetical protein